MLNGMYQCREVNLVIYDNGEEGVLIAKHSDFPDEHIIVTGEKAMTIMTNLIEALNEVTDREEEA